jgi:hypothetical protein
VRVAAAGVRQHEQPRAVDGRALKTGFDHRLGAGRHVAQHPPERPVHRHADEGDNRRPEARDLPFKNPPSLEVLGRTQIVDSRTRPRDQVGHPDAPFREPDVILVRDRLGHDAGGVE